MVHGREGRPRRRGWTPLDLIPDRSRVFADDLRNLVHPVYRSFGVRLREKDGEQVAFGERCSDSTELRGNVEPAAIAAAAAMAQRSSSDSQ